MKTKIIAILNVVILLITVSTLNAKSLYSEKTTTIDLSTNMICNTSMGIIKKALKKTKGVETVEFDANAKNVTVTYDDSITDVSKLETIISAAGFKANDKEADQMAYESLPGCCKTK